MKYNYGVTGGQQGDEISEEEFSLIMIKEFKIHSNYLIEVLMLRSHGKQKVLFLSSFI